MARGLGASFSLSFKNGFFKFWGALQLFFSVFHFILFLTFWGALGGLAALFLIFSKKILSLKGDVHLKFSGQIGHNSGT